MSFILGASSSLLITDLIQTSRMYLLSCPLSCSLHLSLHSTPLCSNSQCRMVEQALRSGATLACAKWKGGSPGNAHKSRGNREWFRVHAEVDEGFASEGLKVKDLSDLPENSQNLSTEEGSLSVGSLSEEDEYREALLFEQGGGEAGPSVEEAEEAAGPSVEEAKEAAGLHQMSETIPLKKGQGYNIADFLMIFGGLLDRPFGSGSGIAAAGSAVIERLQSEIEIIKERDRVDEQLLFEVIRVIRLLEMDLKLVSAAKKESTLLERLDQAKKHCREAVLLANAL